MENKKPAHSWFKMGLRGQQVVLFLIVSLAPLLVVSLTIKALGGNALKRNVGESLALLAREKLFLADRAIFQRVRNIRNELSNLRPEVIKANAANVDKDVFWEVRGNLEDSIRLLETYAGRPRRGFRNRGERNRDRNGATVITSEVTITNVDGYVLRSNNPNIDYKRNELPTQVKEEVWWDHALSKEYGFDYAEDVQYDETREIHYLTIALPIRDGSQRRPSTQEKNTIGVLKVTFSIPELSNVVESMEDMNTQTILTSQSGIIVAASEESGYRINQEMRFEQAVAKAIAEAKKGREGETYGYVVQGESDKNNEMRVYGWARTTPSRWQPWKKEQNFANWIVFVSYPSSEAYAGVNKLNQYVFWVTILSCLIVVPVAYVAAQRISLPVMQLAETAKRIGQEAKQVVQEESDQVRKNIANMRWFKDEETELIAAESRNEVGMLAHEFNEMHHNLKIAVEKLINAEQQMTAIVDCLSEGLIVVDTHDHILYFNPAAKQLLNYSDTSQFPDRFTELLSTTDLTVLANTHGKDTRATVEINLDQEGKNRVLRVVTSYFSSIQTTTNDENTEMAGMVYVFDDITREHEIDQMKSDFVALVSHELRTPLTSIIGFISLILDGKAGPLNKDQQLSLTRVHRQSKRLAMMINDLLDISRIEAGRIVMNLEPVDLAEITQQRLEELKPQADEKTINLDLRVQPDLPQLTGDEERIGQIITNLVGNAIKFTPPNGNVTIKISNKKCPLENTTSDTDDLEGIHVEVIDTGPGIPPQERENIFDKFQQLGNVQTREQGGTGLGLSIARGFVEAHKGKIWVDAGEDEKGCNFQFWIPFLS